MSFHGLVIGRTGQLGRALSDMDGTNGLSIETMSREELDLSAPEDVLKTTLQSFPDADAYIIAAAYTAVDQAETDQETAYHVNAVSTRVIAEHCADNNIPLVYISTDYVFDGQKDGYYQPQDKTAPLNVYGQSKCEGEKAILGCQNLRAAIIRTSWVYDGIGKNFFTTMMRLGQSRTALSVVDDQYGRPTYAPHLAEAAILAAKALKNLSKPRTKIYHVSDSGAVLSWADFAKSIFDQGQGLLPHAVEVSPIPAKDYPTPAARPKNSAMDLSEFEADHNYTVPQWKDGLSKALEVYKDTQA